jgi:hypothetical protein
MGTSPFAPRAHKYIHINIYTKMTTTSTTSTKPGVSYSQIRDQLRTTDLLLFRGCDFVSNTISHVEQFKNGCGDFTHSGICVRAESFTTRPYWWTAGKIYILESTISGYKHLSDGVPDVEGKNTLSVQLRDLDQVVVNYDKTPDARLGWVPMIDQYRPIGIDNESKELQATYDHYRGLTYDASLIDLTSAALPVMRPIRDNRLFKCVRDMIGALILGTNRSDSTDHPEQLPADNYVSNWQFCSELVSNIYLDLGIFPQTVNPENVMPTDFLTNSTDPSVTNDADHEIPALFKECVRYHA